MTLEIGKRKFMKMRHHSRCKGFTLIELMVALTVAAALATLAVPAFRDQFQKRRIKGAADNLYASLQYARSEAVKRNRGVHVNFTVTSTTNWCYGLSEDNNTRPLGGAEVACDCATTPANCIVNGQQKVVTSADYPDVEITSDYGHAAGDNLTFDPVRGTIVAANPTNDVTLGIGSKLVRVRTTLLGQVQICAPSGSTLTSYQACP